MLFEQFRAVCKFLVTHLLRGIDDAGVVAELQRADHSCSDAHQQRERDLLQENRERRREKAVSDKTSLTSWLTFLSSGWFVLRARTWSARVSPFQLDKTFTIPVYHWLRSFTFYIYQLLEHHDFKYKCCGCPASNLICVFLSCKINIKNLKYLDGVLSRHDATRWEVDC